MLHPIGAFQASVNGHEAGFQQLATLFFGGPLPDDGIDHAVLVLKSHKGYASSGFGTLAHPNQPGKSHPPAMLHLGQLG